MISINSFINTLYKLISSSPTTVTTIILGIIFLISMIISIKKNKKIEKRLFIIGWLFIIIFIVLKYNNYLTTLADNLVNNIFMEIFFPNFASYIIVIAFTNFIFLFTILNGKSKTNDKIINTIFFIIIIGLMLLTLDEISKNNINIYEKLDVYKDKSLIVLIESTTIIFAFWLLLLISKFSIKILIKKSDDKVREKYNAVEKDSQAIDNSVESNLRENNNTVENNFDNITVSLSTVQPIDINEAPSTIDNVNTITDNQPINVDEIPTTVDTITDNQPVNVDEISVTFDNDSTNQLFESKDNMVEKTFDKNAEKVNVVENFIDEKSLAIFKCAPLDNSNDEIEILKL